MERRGGTQHRQRLLAPVSGIVVEVGAGTGANFSHYGPGVDRVRAIEPDPVLRAEAQYVAREANAIITVTDGIAQELPFDSNSADWVVCSLVLCTVPDQAAALAEIRRVLKPDRRLAFYEHVRSANPLLSAVEHAMATPWGAIAGGCHPDRDTVSAIIEAGFELRSIERFGFSPHPLLPKVAHVLGTAARRG